MNYFFVDYENVKNQGLEGIEELTAEDTVIVFYSQNANTMTFETHKKLCSAKANIVFERVNVGFKNALDFQLSSYIGYVIAKTEEYEVSYHLVTNDSAFACIGRFWGRKFKSFSVIERIADRLEKGVLMPEVPETAKKKTDVLPEENEAAAAAEPETPDISAEPEEMIKIAEVSLVDEAKKKKSPAKKTKAAKNDERDPELEMKLEAVLSDKSEIPVIVKIIKQYKTKQGINNALMKQFPSRDNQKSGEIYQAIKPLLTDKKGK